MPICSRDAAGAEYIGEVVVTRPVESLDHLGPQTASATAGAGVPPTDVSIAVRFSSSG